MISKNNKKKKTLTQKRKIAIISLVVAIALLIPLLVVVNFLVKTYPYYDTDGTKYLLKYRSGQYALYDTDGNRLAIDPEYGYFVTDIGTLVSIDAETGEIEEIVIPDTEYNEEVDNQYTTRLMMFKHLTKDNIVSIEVMNSEGGFTFYRYNPLTDKVDNTSAFTIKGAPFAGFSEEKFATLYVDAGYTIVGSKINDPIKDANGEFTEYGLAPEKRVDEDGEEYDYVPAYYVITDTSGNKHKVIIGDELVDGGGYYAQYVDVSGETEIKRDAVYVMASTVGKTMLVPVEEYVTPTVVYPMSLTTYLMVDDFIISQKDETQGDGRREIVGFSFVDTEERAGTMLEKYNFAFDLKSYSGYLPDPNNVQACLENLLDTGFAGVVKLCPENEDLLKYGLAKEVTDKDGNTKVEYDSEYSISFKYDILDENDKYQTTIRQLVLISEPNENGNYYAYTLVYDATTDKNEFLYTFDMIVEVESYSFDFLTWDSAKWINKNFLSLSIPFCESIKIESPEFSADFILDNSASVQPEDKTQTPNTNNLKVIATSSKGDSVTTFGGLTAIDGSGNVWTVTHSTIKAVSSAGVELTIANAYNAYNAIGRNVKVLSSPIVCNDGTTVDVKADTVTVTKTNGESTAYVRYGTTSFRELYETLVASDIENSYTMSAEEEEKLTSDSSKLLMTITMKDTEGGENIYKLYKLTSRKAYLTINGNGGFYVSTSRVQKIVNDMQRFFAFEKIDSSAKN